jgi:putative acetyltransferase
MYTLIRTDSDNKDFQLLVSELDNYLAIRNGDTNDFFAQYKKIDLMKNVVLAYDGNEPVGCGAMKDFEGYAMEIKRMYVPTDKRGKGIARMILTELEQWAKELGYNRCKLETGDDMNDAVGLYTKCNYILIPNYGQYKDICNSVCFEKMI